MSATSKEPSKEPERVTGTLCGQPVGNGLVTYPCTRLQGHRQVPSDDPEPCYAMEVGPSRYAHAKWRDRQAERPDRPQRTVSQCPRCGGPLLLIDAEGGTTVGCGQCGASVGRVAAQPAGTVADQLSAATAASRGGLPDRPTTKADAEANLIQRTHGDVPAPIVSTETEPLRQRPGDQPLPTPNDWESAHDRVIRAVQARKDLGLRRYGSVLQPFNGRDGLLDLSEELMDALAYVERLRAAQGATRDELVKVAETALVMHATNISNRAIAETVVDALLEALALRALRGRV